MKHKMTIINNSKGVVKFSDGQKLKFQTGVVSEHGVNGIQVDDAIRALIGRMKYLNTLKRSSFNDRTISALDVALKAQNDRTEDRKQRGVEGTERD